MKKSSQAYRDDASLLSDEYLDVDDVGETAGLLTSGGRGSSSVPAPLVAVDDDIEALRTTATAAAALTTENGARDGDGDGGEDKNGKNSSSNSSTRVNIGSGTASDNNGTEFVSWKDLPRKGQLCIITVARMSEPLVQTSLQAYMFYQLKWFDPTLPDSTISAQAGVLHASFTGAQFLTAMPWGRVADSPYAGRKAVILIGLFCTSFSCLGFGLSTSFWQALAFRTIGGITNGNVGVMRTMISEIVHEKKYQSRAFLLLPMTFNVGIILGPILGGILSDPAGSYPKLFGKFDFLVKYPYAAPNIISFILLFTAGTAVWLGLEETHTKLRDGQPDRGRALGTKLAAFVRRLVGRFRRSRRIKLHTEYTPLRAGRAVWAGSETTTPGPSSPGSETPKPVRPPVQEQARRPRQRYTKQLPFHRMFTRNVSLILIAHFLLAFHIGTFQTLWFVFLSTPVWDPETSSHKLRLPFQFTGGIGLQPRSVGIAMAILGVIGINMQLLLYPRIAARVGTVRSLRTALLAFPIAYFLAPFLAAIPSTTAPPSPKTGPGIWVGILCVLLVQVTGRTFALPAQAIIVNNSSPHPSVLGTIHGLAQSVSSCARTIGPMVGGLIYGQGLEKGVVGMVWWILCAIGICGAAASLLVKDGDGHEIWLEGDDEDERPQEEQRDEEETGEARR